VADGLALATGSALRTLVLPDAEGDGFGVGVEPTNMRWNSEDFLGVGEGEAVGEGDSFVLGAVFSLGVSLGVEEDLGDATGMAETLGLGLGLGVGVGVGEALD
jgi:hypothetical protein